jgi:hypothetical protein
MYCKRRVCISLHISSSGDKTGRSRRPSGEVVGRGLLLLESQVRLGDEF